MCVSVCRVCRSARRMYIVGCIYINQIEITGIRLETCQQLSIYRE